jgi:hypothetical protein
MIIRNPFRETPQTKKQMNDSHIHVTRSLKPSDNRKQSTEPTNTHPLEN